MTLDDESAAAILRAVKQAEHREMCGFLTVNSERRQEFHRMTNRSAEPDRFWISRADAARFMRKASRDNLTVLGFVHSHRSDLRLSCEDQISLDASPIPWIVVAAENDRLVFAVHHSSEHTAVAGQPAEHRGAF